MQYEAALSEYRAKRTHAVNALIMLSFFGGLALALLVTMLALLRRTVSGRPALAADRGGPGLLRLSSRPFRRAHRMKAVEAAAVGFAPCPPRPNAEPKDKAAGSRPLRRRSRPTPSCGALPRNSAGRKAMEKNLTPIALPCGSTRRPARPVPARATRAASRWHGIRLLVAGGDGRVALPGLAPAAGQGQRLFIDAHNGTGRIQSCELLVK